MILPNFRLAIIYLASAFALWAGPAEEALNKSAAYFNSAKILSLDFQVKVKYQVSGEESRQNGSLLVGQGDKFRLVLPGQKVQSDGVTLWQFNESQKQVLIKSLLDLESAFHPSEVLFKYLKCKPISIEKKDIDGQATYRLLLDPTNYIRSFTAMEVWLKTTDHSPVRLKTVDVSGNISWYEITNLRRDPPVKESDFVFVLPAGVEEIDMR